jgi:hypothetical protein
MLKRIRKQNDYKSEFINKLRNIDKSKNTFSIFHDWLIAASASVYSCMKDADVENEYLKIAKLYSKNKLIMMSELLGITINALGANMEDFLGTIFMEINSSNERPRGKPHGIEKI